MKLNFRHTLTALALTFATVVSAQIQETVGELIYSLGLQVDSTRDNTVPMLQPPAGFEENLPNEFSLETFTPRIAKQGDFQTSGGWAASYYVASSEWAIVTNQTNQEITTAYAYDPFYVYQEAVGTGGMCDQGAYLNELCEVLVNNGSKRFNIDRLSCGEFTQYEESYSLIDFKSYKRLFDRSLSWEENANTIRYALSNNHPVLIGMEIPASFFAVGDDGLFAPTEEEIENYQVAGGHAMAIIGYDSEQFGGAFRVVNSWGDEWGDNGACWITYQDFQTFAISAYMFETELKKPDYISYGETTNGYGRSKIKKNGFFEGYFDEKGKPTKGIYINENLKKCSGGARKMKKMVKKYGGYLMYSDLNFKVPVAAVIYGGVGDEN